MRSAVGSGKLNAMCPHSFTLGGELPSFRVGIFCGGEEETE